LSEVQSITASPVRAAVAQAARKTGVDFDYLLAQARLESGLNPNAQAKGSSASGLFQFLGNTWLGTLERHGAENGLGWAASAIEHGRVADPAMRAQIMALRFDPQASSLMAAELASDNSAALQPILGRQPDASELYLAHFLGQAGAGQFLNALRDNPGQSAASLFPEAAAANRSIFYGPSGARSVGEVMDLLRAKVSAAMGQAGNVTPGESVEPWGLGMSSYGAWNSGSSYPSPQSDPAALPSGPKRASMAETLNSAFGLSDRSTSAPAYVRDAYDRLKGLGL
jgi:hypothetical protein